MLLDHLGNKAIAATVQGLDGALHPPAIPKRLANRHDALGQDGITDELVWPDVCEQFVLGDHTMAVVDQVGKHIEDLRFESAGLPVMTQFIQMRIELIFPKEINHRS
jgi:hypothetical protein